MAKGKDYFDLLAQWMRDNGVTNPREVPDSVVEALLAKAGSA
jgi:hypothetical protein